MCGINCLEERSKEERSLRSLRQPACHLPYPPFSPAGRDAQRPDLFGVVHNQAREALRIATSGWLWGTAPSRSEVAALPLINGHRAPSRRAIGGRISCTRPGVESPLAPVNSWPLLEAPGTRPLDSTGRPPTPTAQRVRHRRRRHQAWTEQLDPDATGAPAKADRGRGGTGGDTPRAPTTEPSGCPVVRCICSHCTLRQGCRCGEGSSPPSGGPSCCLRSS
jgi:hypothetical protein